MFHKISSANKEKILWIRKNNYFDCGMFIIIIFFLVRINIMRKKYTFIDQLMIEDTNPSNKRA